MRRGLKIVLTALGIYLLLFFIVFSINWLALRYLQDQNSVFLVCIGKPIERFDERAIGPCNQYEDKLANLPSSERMTFSIRGSRPDMKICMLPANVYSQIKQEWEKSEQEIRATCENKYPKNKVLELISTKTFQLLYYTYRLHVNPVVYLEKLFFR